MAKALLANTVRDYFRTLAHILTDPGDFFRRERELDDGSVTGPIAFALVTHWIASAVEWIWRGAMGKLFQQWQGQIAHLLSEIAEVDSPGRGAWVGAVEQRFSQWVWGVGPVLLDPFFTLFSILFTGLLVYAGSRILVTPQPLANGSLQAIRFESTIRLLAYASAPGILACLPVAGSVLAYIVSSVVLVIGAHELYRVGWPRAIVIAFFPKVLFAGTLMMGFALMVLGILKWVAGNF